MSRRKRRADSIAFLMGLLAALAVTGLYLTGGLDWIELKTLDLRFLYASAMPEDERIVCVDIDDSSITTVGRWPWHRDVQAGLISILAELEPTALLLDITLGESETVRTITPRHADITTDPLKLGTDGAVIAFPDCEIKAAIAAAGMVYLAFDYSPTATPEARGLTDAVRAWLDAKPSRWNQPAHVLFESFRADQEKNADFDADQRCEEIVHALRYVLGYEPTTRPELLPLERVAAIARPVGAVSPVYFPHARAAKRCGFVVFEPDVDGVMRRMRLLAQHDGRVLPQLAFAVAFDALGLTATDVEAKPGRLLLHVPNRDEPLAVQLDDNGRTLVPWVAKRDWTQQFGSHIPINAVWQVYDRRLKIDQNRESVLALLGQLLSTGLLSDQQQYFDDLSQVIRLESDLRMARYRDDAESVGEIEGWLHEYGELLPEGVAGLRAAVAALNTRPTTGDGNTPLTEDDRRALNDIERALAANDDYRAEIEATMHRLRSRVAGKLCLIGYTATSLADMTPIATSKRAPGVVAHANLLNGLLTGHMAYWAPQWLNGLIASLAGLVAALVSTRRRPWAAGLLLGALALAFVTVAGAWVFQRWTYWIALTPTVGALAVAYFTVLLYRYVFLERESRQIAMALSQYTSATLAKQMAEDAELCKRAEMREVTAVFTDLAGFTTISERIGAERTQRVLNISLGRFSDVMLHYEGMINKFIGDGIFAFWNPVIYPQPDHARRACETAIDLQIALREMVREQREAGGDEVFGDLVLRVGVATGNAIVGPCGSEQKYDYTCIGDSVNVAARLESANKFYGTLILASGTTLEQAGDGFVTRTLGSVQVKGKTRGVPIFELLGRKGDIADELLEYAEHFGQAVAAFQEREWNRALKAFEACSRRQPDDRAARQYAAAAAQHLSAPPGDDWNGALELTEK